MEKHGNEWEDKISGAEFFFPGILELYLQYSMRYALYVLSWAAQIAHSNSLDRRTLQARMIARNFRGHAIPFPDFGLGGGGSGNSKFGLNESLSSCKTAASPSKKNRFCIMFSD